VSYKARFNESDWVAIYFDNTVVTTPDPDFATSWRFIASQDQVCNIYHVQVQQGPANTWWKASGSCKCLTAAGEAEAQTVEVFDLGDNAHKLRLGGQYLSEFDGGSAECDDCGPDALKANADADNAAVVSLVPVVSTVPSDIGLGYTPMGRGYIQCSENKLARLGFGDSQKTTECVDSCPIGEEPEQSVPPGQQTLCLPSYNVHMNDALMPEVTLNRELNGVMELLVATPLQPLHFSEDLSPYPYTIDIQKHSVSLRHDSSCNTNFIAKEDVFDDVDDASWTLVGTGGRNDLTTHIPPLGAEKKIRGLFPSGNKLQKSFKVPAGVQGRLHVTLYSRSPQAENAGTMYVELGSDRRFEGHRAIWCPSPTHNPSELCEMQSVIDFTGSTPEAEMVVTIGVLDAPVLWGFGDFVWEVSRVSASFRYDDFNEGACRLSQNPFEPDDENEALTGRLMVFWGGAQQAQEFVGNEYEFNLVIEYPRITMASTDEQYTSWVKLYLGSETETATAHVSELSLHDSEESNDMSGAVRRFRNNSVVWGWQNLTKATHTLVVQEVYMSPNKSPTDNSGKETFEILSQSTTPGKVWFTFKISAVCESCYVHVVSLTIPPVFSNTTTTSPRFADTSGSTTTEVPDAPKRRLAKTLKSPALSKGVRRLSHHVGTVNEGSGRGLAVNRDVLMIDPAPVNEPEVTLEVDVGHSVAATVFSPIIMGLLLFARAVSMR
jgi:hypothetical protein